MPCGWEGNRMSGVALAMRHRLQWFGREMSTRPTLLMAVAHFTFHPSDKGLVHNVVSHAVTNPNTKL